MVGYVINSDWFAKSRLLIIPIIEQHNRYISGMGGARGRGGHVYLVIIMVLFKWKTSQCSRFWFWKSPIAFYNIYIFKFYII
ncbi:hypothetical protein C6366_18405 [Desulfonatronum sp. SC1]|nr:hypothetical protein C6366_18405 [Desulfonatronum sp. SC1]